MRVHCRHANETPGRNDRAKTQPLRFGSRITTLPSGMYLPLTAEVTVVGGKKRIQRGLPLSQYTMRLGLFGGLKALTDSGSVSQSEFSDGSPAWLIETPENSLSPQIYAGPYETFQETYGGLPVEGHCFPEDREFVEVALSLCKYQFERLIRVFGPLPEGKAVFIEAVAPKSAPLPTRIFSSRTIAHLRHYEEDFQAGHGAAMNVYDNALVQSSHRALCSHFSNRFQFASSIASMRQGLFNLLKSDLEMESVWSDQLRTIREFSFYSPRGRGLINVDEKNRYFQRPFVATAEMTEKHTPVPPLKKQEIATLIWRMLRYTLKDEMFCVLLRDLVKTEGLITPERMQRIAEARYGKPLDWFFDQWFYGTGLPKYEILRAEAVMVNNPKTNEIDYSIEVVVGNKGQGRMPAPVFVGTELETVEQTLWIDSHSSATLSLLTPGRPQAAMVDPEGWIAQESQWYEDRKTRDRPMRKIEIVEKFSKGATKARPRTASSAKGMGKGKSGGGGGGGR